MRRYFLVQFFSPCYKLIFSSEVKLIHNQVLINVGTYDPNKGIETANNL